jgi:hypothetical protein
MVDISTRKAGLPMTHSESRTPVSLSMILGLTIALSCLVGPSNEAAAEEAGFDHDHQAWSSLLGRYVKRGNVDYSGWKSGGHGELKRYLSTLEGTSKAQHDGWSRHQQLAFWINAYNAYTVSVILDNMPTQSIMKIGGGNGAVFKQRFVPLGHLRGGSAKLSLNDVENKVIRPRFREPRIHFALVCAAKSCPTLRSEAYRGSVLRRQLEQQTRSFIRNGSANRYDAATNTLHLSRIFEWYAEDFERGDSTVATSVGRYLGGEAEAAINSATPTLRYLEYDWSLNGR